MLVISPFQGYCKPWRRVCQPDAVLLTSQNYEESTVKRHTLQSKKSPRQKLTLDEAISVLKELTKSAL